MPWPLPHPTEPVVSRLVRALPRVRNRHMAILDAYLLPIAAILAFVLRLETLDLRAYSIAVWTYAVVALLVKLPIFWLMGLYSRFWRYASAEDGMLLARAALVGSVFEGALVLGVLAPLGLVTPVPRSIPLIDLVLTLFCIAAPRFALRIGIQIARRRAKAGGAHGPSRRVLIAGAGEAGSLVIRELEANPQTGLVPMGLVDDDRRKLGMYVHRYRVLGTRQDIPELVRRFDVDQLIIAMPTAPGPTVRDILETGRRLGVAVRTLPALYELMSGKVSLQQIRKVQIEDLLRREPVHTDTAAIAGLIGGRRVLVTGAGGSIGSELCRQIARCAPAELILLGHGENSIFEITNELRADGPAVRLASVIADVRDRERLSAVLAQYRPELVFHAAAHKHVPLMEANVPDAITNNVLGTRNLVDLCAASGVTHFVLISTDKAINPTSVMGATKRVAELIVQQAALRTGRCFVAVRFGNVLGSRGSVIPFFEKQIAAGGPVTVTHPEMRRYFMTIPEAVQLVLQAGALGHGGEVFVLDMGQPVRISDLAADLIRLSGLEPDRDVEIRYTGLRPGEKLFEELFRPGESYARTEHQKIFVCRNGAGPEHVPAALDEQLDRLIDAARHADPDQARRHLRQVVPEYEPPLPPAGQAQVLGSRAPEKVRCTTPALACAPGRSEPNLVRPKMPVRAMDATP